MRGELLVVARSRCSAGQPDASSIECYNWKKRELTWSYPLDGILDAFAGIVECDGILYCSFSSRKRSSSGWEITRTAIVALRLSDGAKLAGYSAVEGETSGPPTCDDQLVYFATGAWGVSADIHVLDAGNLQRQALWVNAGTYIPVIASRFVIAQSMGNYVTCTSKATGKRQWPGAIKAWTGAAHSLAVGKHGSQLIIESSPDPQELMAVEVETGKIVWRHPLFVRGLSAGSGRFVYVPGWHEHMPGRKTPTGGFYCFDSATGKLVWRYERRNLRGLSVIVSDGALFGLDADGYLSKFTPTPATLTLQTTPSR